MEIESQKEFYDIDQSDNPDSRSSLPTWALERERERGLVGVVKRWSFNFYFFIFTLVSCRWRDYCLRVKLV